MSKNGNIMFLVRCPFPDCNHIGTSITNVHSKEFHSMPKKELFEKYGKPQYVDIDPYAFSQNRKIKRPY